MPVADSGRHQRREVHYRGRVQGVGFRYTAYQIASRFAVTGYVRNLPDGRVQLVAEGSPKELGEFLAAVLSQFGGYIADVREEVRPADGSFEGFDIRP